VVGCRRLTPIGIEGDDPPSIAIRAAEVALPSPLAHRRPLAGFPRVPSFGSGMAPSGRSHCVLPPKATPSLPGLCVTNRAGESKDKTPSGAQSPRRAGWQGPVPGSARNRGPSSTRGDGCRGRGRATRKAGRGRGRGAKRVETRNRLPNVPQEAGYVGIGNCRTTKSLKIVEQSDADRRLHESSAIPTELGRSDP
jgi:hypothetical protein